MTTIEKLFVQVFERKNRIIEQVKHQTDLYGQHLASKLLIDGTTPPSWLWNPNFGSRSSDTTELKKEELISELLLPHPQPAVPYSGGHSSLCNKPVVIGDNGELPQGLFMETHASRKGFNTEDRPTTLLEGHHNDIGCVPNCMPEFDLNTSSPHRETEVSISTIYADNGFNVGDRPTTVLNCHDNDIGHAFNCVPDFGLSATSPQGQTEVRISNNNTALDWSLARIQRSKSRQKALELRESAKAAAKSRLTNENHTGVCSSVNNLSRIVSQLIDQGNELFGSDKYSDTIIDNCVVREAVGECLSKEKNDNGRITRSRSSCNQSSRESRSLKLENSSNIGKGDGCRMIRSQSSYIEGMSKPVSSSYTASQRVTRSKSGASKKPPLDNSLYRSEGFHRQNALGGELIPHSPKSDAIVNKDGKADAISETELISEGLLEVQAACSESNLDADCVRVGFVASVSRPPVFGMFVKPQTLDFDDMEKCCLNKTSSPMLEKGQLETTSEKKCCTPVNSTASPDKITLANISSKSPEKQSLEEEVSNRKTDAWRDSSETFVEECVVHNEKVPNDKVPKLNMDKNLRNAEVNSESVQQIRHSPVPHGSDTALSSAGKGLDVQIYREVKCHLIEGSESPPKVQVVECGIGYDGRDRSETTPFSSKHPQLVSSFDSRLAKHSTEDQGCRVGEVGLTDPSSSVLDVSQCCAEANQDLMYLENKTDEGKMSVVTCNERTLLENISHVGEDGFLACGSTGSVYHEDNSSCPSKIVELSLPQKPLLPGRRLRSPTENSWPQSKRRQIEGQQANFLSASPSCRVKEIHWMGVRHNLQFQHFPLSGDVAQSNGDKSPDVEKHWKVNYHLTQGTDPSPELHQDEFGFEESNPSTNNPSVFKNGQLRPYVLPSFIKEAAGDFQDCSVEIAETADTNSIDLHSGNNVSLENKDDLTLTERMLPGTEPYSEEGVSFSSVVSPQDKHVDSIAADQTMPEFEGFIIGTEDNGQPHIVGDAFSLDKYDLPRTTIERASILEQLCRSASMLTPLPQSSTTFKLLRTPDLYKSVPNGVLERMDLRSTLNLNDGGKQLRASYSYVDEAKHEFQGFSYSDCVPYSDPHIDWSLKEHPLSPVGKLWDWFPSNSSSSEKQRSSNPELTCFPIEEDPSISEENENGEEVDDIIQEDICSTMMNCGAKREPLAEITEARVNPPTSVSAAERFPDRSSLDSVDPEVSFTGTHSKVKQQQGNRNNPKRRCTNEATENRHLSVSTNCVKKSTKSLNNRFSKPKLSGKTSLRKGFQGLTEREPKHNNIISNITSFVPFVQQKQAATVGTGKRDVKVKALEAAEAAKRLEEKRENERKMKKEALKLERARTEQENMRQMELKMKKKEEDQKKKNADMAARKRLREEDERKDKERKRMRTEVRRQQREQGEKFRIGKVEKEVPLGAMDKKLNSGTESDNELRKLQKMENKRGDDDIGKKPHTEPRTAEIVTSSVTQAAVEDCKAFGHCGDTGEPTSVLTKTTENDDLEAKTSREKSYEISPYQCSDDEDEEEDEIRTRKFVPSWASKNSVALVLSSQQEVDPDRIFPPESFCSSDEVLRPRKLQLK